MPVSPSVPEDVPLVEFMYLVFTRMPGESYRAGDSGLCCCVCFDPVNSLVCCYCIKIDIHLIEITSTMLQPWYSCSKPPDELMTAAPVISHLTFMLTVVSFICRERSSLPGPYGFNQFNARREKTGDEGTSTKISVSRRRRKHWNARK